MLPLEDAVKLDQAKPVTPGSGDFRQRPVAVVILGGAHDLMDSASRFTPSRCEYIRATTKRFNELSDR